MLLVLSLGGFGCGESPGVGQRWGVHVARCGPTDSSSVMFGLDSTSQSQLCRQADSLEGIPLLIQLHGRLRSGVFAVDPDPNGAASAWFTPRSGGAEVFLSGTLTIETVEGPIVTGQYELGPFPGEGVRRARFETNRCEDQGSAFTYQRCGSPFVP
jgi:hypothetical protein